jgi:hypothetical protein
MDHEMEMVRHQAPGKCRTYFWEGSFIKRKKDMVIFFFMKNFLTVVALVVDMINMIGAKIHSCL